MFCRCPVRETRVPADISGLKRWAHEPLQPLSTERRVSARVGAISESATLAVDAKAKALKAAGRPVIGFGAGEPDFPTPDYIVEAAVEACRTRSTTATRRPAGCPSSKAAIAAKTLRDSGYEVDAAQVLVTNGGKQAIYEAFAAIARPGRRGHRPGAVLDDLPRVDPARRRCPGRGRRRRDHRLPGHRRAAGGGPHRAHQGRCCSSRPSNPTGAVYTPRARSRRSAAGPSSTACGCSPTRSTSTSSTATREFTLAAGGRARAARQVHRRQRRRQDLRDDRLAGRLDDRPEGRHQGRDQPPVARHLQRLATSPRSPRSPPSPATCDAVAEMREAFDRRRQHDRADAQRDRRRGLPRARGRVLRLPVGEGAARQGDPRQAPADLASSSPR